MSTLNPFLSYHCLLACIRYIINLGSSSCYPYLPQVKLRWPAFFLFAIDLSLTTFLCRQWTMPMCHTDTLGPSSPLIYPIRIHRRIVYRLAGMINSVRYPRTVIYENKRYIKPIIKRRFATIIHPSIHLFLY